MKKITKILSMVLLVGVCAACEDEQKKVENLPFTEYTLEGTSCKWVNLFDEENLGGVSENKLLVINSDKELKKYISGDYPPIDFSGKTLLLAYGGWAGYTFDSYVQYFHQISEQNYTMTVYTPLSALSVIGGWQSAIVVDKLPSKSKIGLNVITK